METETYEQGMLQLAARQTKALESINKILMTFFVLFLIAAVIWLIGLMRGAGVLA